MKSKNVNLEFGLAKTSDEFDQIFRLNHQTFTSEIPQHPPKDDGRLIDRFHSENEYVICKEGTNVVGMVALRATRPFSLDEKLPDLDQYIPPNRSVCEIRLLAVRKGYRHKQILPGLMREIINVSRQRHLDYAVISGTTRQIRLYLHLGFEPFGPLIGKPGAFFQPMGIAIERFSKKVAWLDSQGKVPIPGAEHSYKCLLPSLAQVHPDVLQAAATTPQPHRSREVVAVLENCRKRLVKMVRAETVQVMLGSGTLANDAIAQQLRFICGQGVVLSNGEFGDRLIDHAKRANLNFISYKIKWGKTFDFESITHQLLGNKNLRWIWMAHCETSTGILNDLTKFKRLAKKLRANPILDCVSSFCNVEVDLQDVPFASAVSGKGLAALPGLAFVFHKEGVLHNGCAIPRYLDLGLYAANESIPFTHSSNLIQALAMALDSFKEKNLERRILLSSTIRKALINEGFKVIGDEIDSAPFVVTIVLPPELDSVEVGEKMIKKNFRIGYLSRYLRERNWIQLAWMGDIDIGDALSAVSSLKAVCALRQDLAGQIGNTSGNTKVRYELLLKRLKFHSRHFAFHRKNATPTS
ncbi:MAG: aminotransferase class V-fold PLP-dependent enzyme [Burkholderiales bacterium]